jgi:hypothetical protein
MDPDTKEERGGGGGAPVFNVDVAWDLEPKDLPRHDHVQMEPDTTRSCRREARGGRGSCRGHTAYQAATRSSPPARRHRNPSSTLRQLPHATMSSLLTYMFVSPAGPPSSCRLRTPHRSAAALQPKPPCATTTPPAPGAATTIAATTAHAHQVWLSNATISARRGGGQSSGLPGCPSRFTARPPVSPIAGRRQARLPDKPMPERH